MFVISGLDWATYFERNTGILISVFDECPTHL